MNEALGDTRVVLVNGARQGGKSTLVQLVGTAHTGVLPPGASLTGSVLIGRKPSCSRIPHAEQAIHGQAGSTTTRLMAHMHRGRA